MKNLVRILTNHGDAWVAFHNGRKSRTLVFLYSDEGNPNRIAEAVAAAVRLTGGTVKTAAPAELAFDLDSENDVCAITSPLSGRTYAADCEGAALAKLLCGEPAALMAF